MGMLAKKQGIVQCVSFRWTCMLQTCGLLLLLLLLLLYQSLFCLVSLACCCSLPRARTAFGRTRILSGSPKGSLFFLLSICLNRRHKHFLEDFAKLLWVSHPREWAHSMLDHVDVVAIFRSYLLSRPWRVSARSHNSSWSARIRSLRGYWLIAHQRKLFHLVHIEEGLASTHWWYRWALALILLEVHHDACAFLASRSKSGPLSDYAIHVATNVVATVAHDRSLNAFLRILFKICTYALIK